MHGSNLLDILRAMDKKEIERFTKFVNSSYFNTSIASAVLYNKLMEFYPEFGKEDIKKEALFKKIYKNRSYNDVLMRKSISTIIKLSEQYLSVKRYRENRGENHINLLRELNERNLDIQFNENLKKTGKDLNDLNMYKNEDYYFYYYHLNNVITDFSGTRGNVYTVEEYQQQINSVNRYYLLNTLKLYALLCMHSHSYNVKYDFIMLEEIKQHFKSNAYENEPELLVFYYIMMLFVESPDESENYFVNLKKLLYQVPKLLNKEDIDFLYGMMLQYCIHMSAVYGKTEYSKEKWALLKIRVEVELERLNLINPTDFVNTVSMGISEKQYEWTEKFISDFKHKLAAKYKKDTVNFCYAWLLFSKNEYEKALKHISKLSPVFYQSKSYIKELSIKIYYELGMLEQVYYGIDAYLHYLKNDKSIPGYMLERDVIFIKNFKKLMKLRENGNKEGLNLLLRTVTNSSTPNKGWLLRKIDELLDGNKKGRF